MKNKLKTKLSNIGKIHILKTGKNKQSQDQEWCFVKIGGKQKKIRFHDYAQIYKTPGLYEHIFYNHLKCCSPHKIVKLLNEAIHEYRVFPDSLSVLDLGAGNGMVGEELRSIGVKNVIGTDILPEAGMAALRDRPEVYGNYLVADFLKLPKAAKNTLNKYHLNCLTTVAALGFDDIPTKVFMNALSFISAPGWIAFNIKEDFLKKSDHTGFSNTFRKLQNKGMIKIIIDYHYQHRLSAQGEPLYYRAIVAQLLRSPTRSL